MNVNGLYEFRTKALGWACSLGELLLVLRITRCSFFLYHFVSSMEWEIGYTVSCPTNAQLHSYFPGTPLVEGA